MKILNRILSVLVVLCSLACYAQQVGFTGEYGSLQITWPINNMVFQQDAAGQATIAIAGQVSRGSKYTSAQLADMVILVQKYTYDINNASNHTWTNHRKIQVSTETCAGCSNQPDQDLQTFFRYSENAINLIGTKFSSGWYRMAIGFETGQGCLPFAPWIQAAPWKEFGVGDVYLVAGQSNASGFTLEDDRTLMTYESQGNIDAFNKNPRIPDNSVFRGSIINKILTNNRIEVDREVFGLPLYLTQINLSRPLGYTKFISGQFGDTNEMGIAPNGYDSWSWQRFSNDLVKSNKYPVLIYNVAKPNSGAKEWNNNRWSSHFKRTLDTYGYANGLKAILWQQGEWESGFMLTNSTYSSNVTYLSDLTSLISNSRNNMMNLNLPWFIANTSFITGNSGLDKNLDKFDKAPLDPMYPAVNYNGFSNGNISHKYSSKRNLTQENILTWQNQVRQISNVFTGPDTDFLFEGIRSPFKRLHFDGYESHNGKNGLQYLAEGWVSAVQNLDNSRSSVPARPNKLVLKSKTSSEYKVEVIDGNNNTLTTGQFYWAVNNEEIGSNSSTIKTQSYYNIPINNNIGNDYYLICYHRPNSNVPWTPSQPILVTATCTSCRIVLPNDSRTFSFSNIPSGGNSFNADIGNYIDGAFPITFACLSWARLRFNPITNQYDVEVDANPTNQMRSGTLKITDQSTGLVLTEVNLEQQAGSSPPTTPTSISLTSLQHTCVSQGWSTTRFDGKSITGNTMEVNDEVFLNTPGIGTHAGGVICYDIPTGAQRIMGAVGRDDAADGCGCGAMTMRFEIKFFNSSNSLISTWPSLNVHGIASPKEEFDLVIPSGATKLELHTLDNGDNNWGDHGDWINPRFIMNSSGGGGTGSSTLQSGSCYKIQSVHNNLFATDNGSGEIHFLNNGAGSQIWQFEANGSQFRVKKAGTSSYLFANGNYGEALTLNTNGTSWNFTHNNNNFRVSNSNTVT